MHSHCLWVCMICGVFSELIANVQGIIRETKGRFWIISSLVLEQWLLCQEQALCLTGLLVISD